MLSATQPDATIEDMAFDEVEIPASELFLDDRGTALRVTWHGDRKAAVVSIWRDGACVGTVHLQGTELMRLSTLCTQAWLDDQRRTAADI